MKWIKSNRMAAIFLAVAILWGIVPASAADPIVSADSDLLWEHLQVGLAVEAETVDLSRLSVTPATLRAVYLAVLQDDPALFYVAPRLSYAVSGDGDWVLAVYPSYAFSGESLAEARMFYEGVVAALASEVEGVLSGHPYTDAEIVLLVHDILADRYDYDMRGMESSVAGNIDAYTFFRDGVGVCQAYAMAAIAVLRRLGLEADLVTSAAMDHAWVHVLVGEAWYHLDVTRDDPVDSSVGASAGLVTHTRVLRSDAGMRSLGYHDFSCASGHICTDGRYENSAAIAALEHMQIPLRLVSVGVGAEKGRSLVWLGENAQGEMRPLRLTDEGITLQKSWDIDGDGAITLGDLLLLSDESLPEAWQVRLRQYFMG